ncbi:hypothetical protein ACQ4WP_26955 [Janthinobacterium sp. GB4P2]|uniref:hypothetical protein n=1 Tax=Janthinobacterium sp. GB4P2 TaxID=3424189 RepID=UPI003F295E19
MPNDPKWRTIARASGQKIGDVIATYLHMMTLASNATERGRTQGFKDEDIATALDLDALQVTAIRDAMQGRVLDGDHLTGWEKRQPIREDGSAERGKQHRETERLKKEVESLKNELTEATSNATERSQTQPNAREDKTREDKEKKEPKSKAEAARASRLPADWRPDDADIAFCKTERPDLRPSVVASTFFDYWIALPGAKGRKVDWSATWRNWVRNEKLQPAPRASPGHPFDLVATQRAANDEAKRRLGILANDNSERIIDARE